MDIKTLLQGNPALAQVLQNIQQVLWVLELGTGSIQYVSPAFETIWGYSCESLYTDPLEFFQCVHPEDRVKVISAAQDKHRTSQTISFRIIRPDGSLRWISAQTILIKVESPEATLQVYIAQDVTPQNQMEHTLRKALDRSREQFTLSRRMSLARKHDAVLKTLMSCSELRNARRALVLFFENPPGGLAHGMEVIASWSSSPNPADFPPESAMTDTVLSKDLELSPIIEATKPVIVTDICNEQRLASALRSRLLDMHIQTIAIFPMVALARSLGCLVVFYEHERQIQRLEMRHIKVLVDQATITLTNLHLLEIEAESRREAEQANEIKIRFLAMISHELRTPLTSIKGFTTTLLARDVTWTPDEQRDFVQTIEQEASRLQELIDHLLDLSRLEAGMMPIIQHTYSLHEIITDVMPQFQVMTQKHILSLRLPVDLPPVWVDAKRIAQVVVNLVQNSAKYSPPGTEIVLTANPRGRFLEVSVCDQGSGIPPAWRKRAFQPFRRGVDEENGFGKGAGLGLAICRGLVEAHGGWIWIRRQSTPGTTISFTIPLVSPKELTIAPGKV